MTASRTATATGADAEEEGEAPKTYTGFGSGDEEATQQDGAEGDAPEESVAPAPATNAATALDFGRTYGLPVVFAGLFAVFGLVM